MKSVLLIGLGRFGRHMAEKLQELHHEVLAVDRNEQRVNEILPLVTNAQIGDSTNEQFIESLGIRNFDLCVHWRRFSKLFGDHRTFERTWGALCTGAGQPRRTRQISSAQWRR